MSDEIMVPSCAVDDCNLPVKSQGYCTGHYNRLRKYGDPLGGRPLYQPVPDHCGVEGCKRPAYAKGYCNPHYNRLRMYGDPEGGSPIREARPDRCRVSGCKYTQRIRAQGYCDAHYSRFLKYGDPLGGWSNPTRKHDQPCSLDGCEAPQKALGYCNRHYQRLKIHGDPNARVRGQDGLGTIMMHGYRAIPAPGHPNADKRGRILEHRKVMSDLIGRPLLSEETVHHKNGDRLDNRPENLELWARAHHDGTRVSDLLAWAREIIARYEPLEQLRLL